MKIANLFIVLWLGSTVAYGQNGLVEKTLVYKTIDTTSLVTHVFYKNEPPKKGSKGSKPKNVALVFFHGGGWAFGSPSEFFGACRRYANKGFVAFSFQYRLSVDAQGNVPNPAITPVESVKDVRSAMRWVRAHAAEFNIDPAKIVAGGQSVGGQLVLSTFYIDAYNNAGDDLSVSPEPNAMLLYSGTVNCVEAWCDYMLGSRRQQIWSISPTHNLRSGAPPAIAFHGREDNVVQLWTVQFFKRDTEALGNHHELIIYDGRKHYLGEGNTTYSRLFDEEILERTDDFLRRHNLFQP